MMWATIGLLQVHDDVGDSTAGDNNDEFYDDDDNDASIVDYDDDNNDDDLLPIAHDDFIGLKLEVQDKHDKAKGPFRLDLAFL